MGSIRYYRGTAWESRRAEVCMGHRASTTPTSLVIVGSTRPAHTAWGGGVKGKVGTSTHSSSPGSRSLDSASKYLAHLGE